MDTKEKIIELLGSLIHPETGEDLVKSGFVEQVNASDEHISVALHFAKARDPFAFKLKAQAEALLREAFPAATVTVMLREGTPRKPQQQEHRTTTGAIRHVVAVASGKGGVGKSTVTANLAVALRNMGYRVGVLDADIYGPSQPRMFGVEGYLPDAVQEDGIDQIVPARAQDIELMSIGFFIKPGNCFRYPFILISQYSRSLGYPFRDRFYIITRRHGIPQYLTQTFHLLRDILKQCIDRICCFTRYPLQNNGLFRKQIGRLLGLLIGMACHFG